MNDTKSVLTEEKSLEKDFSMTAFKFPKWMFDEPQKEKHIQLLKTNKTKETLLVQGDLGKEQQ